MSEVKIWYWSPDHVSEFGYGSMDDQPSPVEWPSSLPLVDKSCFDRVTAERDALQQRLTAADERADVLETEVARLNRVKLSLKELADSRADNCSVYRQHLTMALALAEKVRAASLGMQRKFLADLIDHLHQSDAALKPAEAAKCDVCGQGAWACNEGGCHYLESGNGDPADGGGDDWKSWAVGNTVRYQGSGQDGEDCYCRMRKGSDYLIHEAPDDHESMVVLDDDGDELCVLVGEFKWIKP